MDTIKSAAATVIGARHQRAGRNGQDAAYVSVGGAVAIAVAVVCDGCSSGKSSELGARLGAALYARAIESRLLRGEPVTSAATWEAARADVVGVLASLLERLPGDRVDAIREQLLFTIVAAAITPDGAVVWALGDGAYWHGGVTHVLGPFADNAPPYLAYDLLGEGADATFVVAGDVDCVVIATDGADDLPSGLAPFAAERYVAHPDALRRQLALLARGDEHIDWIESRVVRTPAVLQDDCAIAILRRVS
jgi:hypothetical protein